MYNGSIFKLKIFKVALISAFFLAMGVIPSLAFSQENTTKTEEKKFNPSEVIMEHIADKHEWHLAGKAILPLPIILYTDKGFEVFSSGKLQPAGQVYKGAYYNYMLINNKVKAVNDAGKPDETINKKIWDFSVTQNVISMWMTGAVLMIVFLGISSAYKKRVGKAPKGVQSFMEPIILFIRDDIAIPNIGVKYARFMPLLLTIFFFILINNLFGMIPIFPGGYNLTGNIAVTLTLAVIIMLVVNVNGNKYYWKHIFLPDVPFWILPIMWIVEIIGVFSKPGALMIRLFANMTAGHIVILSLISLIFIFNTLWISPVSVVFAVFIDVIELLVVFLQAYVFTMLSSLFIGMAIEEHHHEHEIL
jgi:F-type H+-transporting ATPase subunit a